MSRIPSAFARRPALVAYVMAGEPDLKEGVRDEESTDPCVAV